MLEPWAIGDHDLRHVVCLWAVFFFFFFFFFLGFFFFFFFLHFSATGVR